VYNTANKLFTLSKFAPVGVLVYNNAEINSVPVEIIIKGFRDQLGQKRFKTLKEYGACFLDFLQTGSPMTADSKELNFAQLLYLTIRNVFENAIRLRSETTEQHDLNFYISESARELSAIAERAGPFEQFSKLSIDDVAKERKEFIAQIFYEVVTHFKQEHDLPELKDELIAAIVRCALMHVFSRMRLPNYTGVVIAGYGDNEYFPSYQKYETNGFTPYGLRCYGPIVSEITHDNGAEVGAFAQADMAEVFMEGIDKDNRDYIKGCIDDLFEGVPGLIASRFGIDASAVAEYMKLVREELGETVKQFHDTFAEFRRERFTRPILEAINHLDKSDLGSMAESLVAITALKRRVSLGAETVGGPIDVAVISKYDGFIWLKRKHYFNLELNGSFFNRYLLLQNAGNVDDS
jgi:hypothetical protein